MNELQDILAILEIVGVVAFSISGAMVAIEEKLDFFGVLFMGVITAMGGGIIRDTLLGNLPPAMFGNYHCIAISLVTSSFVFLVAYISKDYYFSHTEVIEKINNTIDAVGLGVFTISGIQIARATEFGYNYILLIVIGMVTGVGGGLIRDIVVGRKPLIFSKHIYAVASIAGCICFLECMRINISESVSISVSIILVFLIRIMSARFKWNLPKVC